MKKILITGANSYIGTRFADYLSQWPEQYQVDTLDMVGENWRSASFAGYDCVFHVAGLVHLKETKENEALFFRVNRDMAIESAKKAKAEGVRQFLFMSSMGVYGITEGPLDPNAATNPVCNYGKSKLQAEQGIVPLRDENFAVAIMRPPMVYGPGCKGNYRHLVMFAKVMPFFPAYENKRSMLSVENLVIHLKQLVDTQADGLSFPQDETYVCTCRMVQQIGADMGRKIPLLKILNPFVSLAKHCTKAGRKAFGDLYYTK